MIHGLAEIFEGKYSRIFIIAVGNYFRSDDGAGPRILERLKPTARVQLLNAETNLERYIEPIKESGADVLLFLDCIHFGKEPGYTALLPVAQIEDYTLHSHNISLKRISDFFSVPAYVLGIQPASLKVSETLSEGVAAAVEEVVRELEGLMGQYGNKK